MIPLLNRSKERIHVYVNDLSGVADSF